MFNEMKKNEKGFTLVELVVVVAILALLAALLVPRIMGNVDEAKESRDLANARTIASEVTTHNALARVNGTATVPTTLPGAVTSTEMGAIGRVPADFPATYTITVDADGNASYALTTP